MTMLADDPAVVERLLDHIDHATTDLAEGSWREPVENYRSERRFAAELEVLRRTPTPFCPSAALPEAGAFVARAAAGTPVLAVRGSDGRVRAFRNACRHRGTELAAGSGSTRAFVCRYHGWTYGLDGRLRHVPDEHGFPGLEKHARGLVPLEAEERQGLVFVTQDPGLAPEDAALDELPPLLAPSLRLVGSSERDVPANWKILVEGFLEGYHIRWTHPKTFYPVQFDNLNLVERFGRNSRIAFPYQAIHKLRALPRAERRAEGKLTYVYHLFPNVMLATFPHFVFLVALEPLAIDRTRFVTSVLTDRPAGDAEAEAASQRGADLVGAGAAEDNEVACAIQRSLASGANEFFEFGRFEGAIAHFHRALDAALEAKRLS
jgi:phenylpropionate dioxygenase-like ring-hydroxylating dioxygenase large terminal subunit